MINDETKELRKIVIKNVLFEIANGMSREQACEKHNISTRTFIRYMAEFPELSEKVKTIYSETINGKLESITNKRLEMMDELISRIGDVTAMKTKDLLVMERRLKDFQIEIQDMLKRVEPRTPKLTTGNSEKEEEAPEPVVDDQPQGLPQPQLTKWEYPIVDGTVHE